MIISYTVERHHHRLTVKPGPRDEFYYVPAIGFWKFDGITGRYGWVDERGRWRQRGDSHDTYVTRPVDLFIRYFGVETIHTPMMVPAGL